MQRSSGGVGSREARRVGGQRDRWGISLPSAQFCGEPKTALKSQVYIKTKKKGGGTTTE